ncbi:MAG: glycosyl hydrolase family 28 protein, partial [Cyclobacteriaceae bacterium]
ASFITLRDVTFQNSPSHVLRFEDSEQIIIDGIYIKNHRQSPNTDGIDLVDSKNVFISNSYIATGDDAICLKTDVDGIVENVVVTNCILESDDAAIKFGTGSAGITRYCSFNNITIKNSRYGISLFMLEGGLFEFNSFTDIIINEGSRHKHEYPIFIDVDRKRPTDAYGIIRNTRFSNLIINSGGKILINGRPEQPIQGLALQNIRFAVSTERDFSNATKPRGNKNFPKLPESIDRAPVPAYFTLGYINDLHLSGSSIRTTSNAVRKDADLIGISNMIIYNNSGRDLATLK